MAAHFFFLNQSGQAKEASAFVSSQQLLKDFKASAGSTAAKSTNKKASTRGNRDAKPATTADGYASASVDQASESSMSDIPVSQCIGDELYRPTSDHP